MSWSRPCLFSSCTTMESVRYNQGDDKRAGSTSDTKQHSSGGPFAHIKDPLSPTPHKGMDFHLCCLAQAKSPGTESCSPGFSPTLGSFWGTLYIWSFYTTRTGSVLVEWSHLPWEDNQRQGAQVGCCTAILASWVCRKPSLASPGLCLPMPCGVRTPPHTAAEAFPWDKSTVNCKVDVFKASMLHQ